MNVTSDGRTCLRWDEQLTNPNRLNFTDATVSDAANYCRIPDGDPDHEGQYCLTDGPEYGCCDVPLCKGNCIKTANHKYILVTSGGGSNNYVLNVLASLVDGVTLLS